MESGAESPHSKTLRDFAGAAFFRQVLECVRFAPFFVLLALFATESSARGAAVTARLDRDTIMVGDSATLEVQVQNAKPTAQPVFQAPQNVTIEYQGYGQSTSIVNGNATFSFNLGFRVSATQPGTYIIPATIVQTDAGPISTQPLRLVVTKDESGANGNATGPAFARLQVGKTNVYVGEIFPIQIKVYGLMIDELQVPALKSDGFVIGAQVQGSRSRETVGNNIYNVYTFPISISAAKAGTLMLGPAEAPMVIRVQTRRGGGGIFDEMFGFQQKQVTVRTEPVAMNVMPLPTENRPASFSGAVGNFQISVAASPTNVSVGDPITLQIQVQGSGAFDSVKLPDFGWKDFTLYTPNATVTNTDALQMRGTKIFDEVIVPQRAGIAAIPSIQFSFFDPQARTYKTLSRPAIPISVKATGHGQAQPTVVADQSVETQRNTPATDIVHIKPSLGHLSAISTPVAARPWFIAFELLPVALWGAAVGWRRRTDRLTNDPRLRRKREVEKKIAELLPKLREHAAAKRSDEFFATTFRLLQEQLGERLDMPAAAITEAVVDERLPAAGASPELVRALGELFQACNAARYAGATVAGMEALIPKIQGALQQVKELPGPEGAK
jgi:hypothetical protein